MLARDLDSITHWYQCVSNHEVRQIEQLPLTSIIQKIIIIIIIQELGRRMTSVTGDTREVTYLFQRMSVALQRGNAVSSHSTFTTE